MTSKSPTSAAAFRFTGDDLLDRDRLAMWHEVIGRSLSSLELAVLPDCPFHQELRARPLPQGVSFAFATNAGMRMARTRDLLTDGNDDLILLACTGGSLIAAQRAREVTLDQGHAVLMSYGELCSVTFPSLSRLLLVRMPRQLLAPLVPELDDAPMRAIPKDTVALRLLVSYLDTLGPDQPMAAPDHQRLVATHVRDLIAMTLGASRAADASVELGGVRAARLRAIKADILARLDRHDDVSVVVAAGQQGVTPRYVQALFESEGTTFSAFVISQRLSHAYRLLADAGGAHRRIGEVALKVGFNDLSYFNRVFRRQYGVTPSELRAMKARLI